MDILLVVWGLQTFKEQGIHGHTAQAHRECTPRKAGQAKSTTSPSLSFEEKHRVSSEIVSLWFSKIPV
jgi:hypothetical protein